MTLNFICPICDELFPRDSLADITYADRRVIDEIKKENPYWTEDKGVCKNCYQRYKRRFDRQ